MPLKSLDWEIDVVNRVVRFTAVQEIVLQPVKFDLPFAFVQLLGAKVTVAAHDAAQNLPPVIKS